MGSKKVHWDLKKYFEISKNAFRSQTMIWDLKKIQCNLKEMVDIVEIVQAVVMVDNVDIDIVDIDIVDIVDTVEIVDIFDTFNIVDINEAICNKAML